MCKLSDINWLEDVTDFYTVDEEGEPDMKVDTTGGDFRTYYCTEHQEDLGSWEEAQEHLKENA